MSKDRPTGAPADSSPPSTIAPLLRVGRYVLFDKIASGGMASVHFARMDGSVGFSKTVAVKRLHENFANDPEFRAMFLDEARLASRIRHTNVVQPLDILAVEGQLLVALEYVHGESLNGLLSAAFSRREAPHPAIAATIVAGALHGLHAAHEAKDRNGEPLGLVHRDISPHNILVGVFRASLISELRKQSIGRRRRKPGSSKAKLPIWRPNSCRQNRSRQPSISGQQELSFGSY